MAVQRRTHRPPALTPTATRRSSPLGAEAGRRFSWRADRRQKLHELGRAFGLTDDSHDPDGRDAGERDPEGGEESPE